MAMGQLLKATHQLRLSIRSHHIIIVRHEVSLLRCIWSCMVGWENLFYPRLKTTLVQDIVWNKNFSFHSPLKEAYLSPSFSMKKQTKRLICGILRQLELVRSLQKITHAAFQPDMGLLKGVLTRSFHARKFGDVEIRARLLDKSWAIFGQWHARLFWVNVPKCPKNLTIHLSSEGYEETLTGIIVILLCQPYEVESYESVPVLNCVQEENYKERLRLFEP